jgi:predicted DsbA family dithiol-disulfide isomerase
MQIDIFSDVVCPWCYIGKRRLDQVLAGLPPGAATVHWRAFQLYPMLPPEGMPRAEFMRARFGSGADPARIYARILDEAAPLGLELRFDRIQRAPNTLRAHRLLAWAGEYFPDRQHDLAEALFRSYFTDGLDVGDPAVLEDAAAAAGLERHLASVAIACEAGAAEVRAELQDARDADVTGVPFFVLGGRFAIPGAQPVDVLKQLIERAQVRLAELEAIS